jgi:predicted permease
MFTDLMLRLRSLFRHRAVEQELDEELRFHLDQQIAAYEQQGLSRAEATRRARLEFGGLSQAREEHRDARGIGLIEDLGRDLRHGVRQLRRTPAFALAAVLCLALGIGATTAVYSLVNAILLRPLPFHDSDSLVRLIEHAPPNAPGRPLAQRRITYQEFLDWRAKAKTLSDAIAVSGLGQWLVRTPHGSVGLWGGRASGNAFTMLGVRAHLGRTLLAADEADPTVMVLSYDAWQRQFQADPAIVGTSIEVRPGALTGPGPASLSTVVGVLPRNFELPGSSADFYAPIPIRNATARVPMIARLAPGVSLEAAIEEANAIGATMREPWPATAPPLTVPRFHLERVKEQSVEHLRPAFLVLLASVGAVLLIVCANVANLLLARGTARQREMAVRVAIGASRGRIVRQIMGECFVLAAAGGALGALIGAGGIMAVRQLAAVEAPGVFRFTFSENVLPRIHELGVDVTVLTVALGVSALTCLLFGMLPALRLSKTNLVESFGARGGGSGRGESRIRAALTVGQLTLATILLVGAGLLTHSFVKLASVNNGYDPSNVLAFNLLFPNQYSVARKVETIERLLTRLRGAPDVQAAGFSRHGILIGEEIYWGTIVPPGRTLEEMRPLRNRLRSVSSGYLTTMGVPLLDGREFQANEDERTPPAIVISRSAAQRYFGSARAVGQVVDWHLGPYLTQPVTVIGVVEDILQHSPTDEAFPEVFVEYRQFISLLEREQAVESEHFGAERPQRQNELAIGLLSFAIRTGGDPVSAIPRVREIVNAVDANVGVDSIVPMTSLTASAVARQRFYAVILGIFAGIAAALAAIGIYGVLAYLVAQRTKELGIRMALGAKRVELLALVLRKGLMLAGVGISLGLIGAAALTQLLQSLLFGITPLDPGTFAVVAVTFGLVAVLASYIPAYRATSINPVVALRND